MIVTLCTDMGERDYYVPSIKAALMSENDAIRVVDISHHIPKFDISRAAFVLKNVYREFPTGSIHIIGVLPEADADTAHLIVKHDDHYFIGADNGLFNFLFDTAPDEVYEITMPQDTDLLTFPTRYVFVPAAAHLAKGGTPSVIGRLSHLKKNVLAFQPLISEEEVKGHVIHIDSYGNVISNISKQMFMEVGRGREFDLSFGHYTVGRLHSSYNEVPEGEKVALFGGGGYLEIAINKGTRQSGGGADSLLGLNINDPIRFIFK